MNTMKLALRGLMRNRRRSLVTLLTIALGYAAISLFAGYAYNIYDGLARQSIHGEMLGHLTVSKRGMSTQGKLDPGRYMMRGDDVAAISALIAAQPHVKMVAPRLGISGLISNGRASTIFIAEGIGAVAMQTLQAGLLTEEEKQRGTFDDMLKTLDASRPEVALLSSGLAEMLRLEKGDTAPLLSNTLSGQVNALDIVLGDTFNTGSAGSNDKFVFLNLDLAQQLYDAPGAADRLTVLLDDVAQTEPMREILLGKLQTAGYDVEIQTWQELSNFYRQVHNMFDMIFGFIFLIVLTVVVMSVANSMGMTVIERTREIGTLRAIGLKRFGVIKLFTLESLLLALIGCAAGLVITLGVRMAVNNAGISYTPPDSSSEVELLIGLDGERLVFTLLLMAVVGALAAFMPARRAANQPIIDSLGHV